MTSVPVAEKMTAEEFVQLQATHGRHRWLELIDGEVVVNEPGVRHNHVQMNLVVALAVWCRAKPGRGHALNPMDVDVDAHNVFQPDLLWYAEGHVPDSDSPPPYAIPDLAVEVRSPSTWRYDIGAKKAAYENKGLPELWLVDTLARTVLAFRRSRADATAFDVATELEADDDLTSPLLPGFALPVAEVFRVP